MRSRLDDDSIGEGSGRPLVARRYIGAWLVLLLPVVVGIIRYYTYPDLGLFTWHVGESTTGAYMGINYHVYHVAAERAVAGQPFYGVSPGPAASTFVYLYPPVTVASFLPFALLDWTAGYLAFTAFSLLGGVGAAVATVRYIESLGTPLGWVDVALICALFVLSIHITGTVYFGNINLLLGFAFAVGFLALQRGRDGVAGLAFALAALFKIFPALIGLWLVRDRRWRATGVAIAAGSAGLLTGVVLFGVDTTVEFFTSVLAGRSDSAAFVGGLSPEGPFYVTVQRPLSQFIWWLWPAAPYALLPASAALFCGAVIAVFYLEVNSQRDQLFAMFGTVVVALVVVPSFRLYAPLLFLPLVALLYTWTGGPGRRLFLSGALLFSVVARPHHVLRAAEYLGPLEGIVASIGRVVTLQLLAYGLMLGACLRHRRQASPGDESTVAVTTE